MTHDGHIKHHGDEDYLTVRQYRSMLDPPKQPHSNTHKKKSQPTNSKIVLRSRAGITVARVHVIMMRVGTWQLPMRLNAPAAAL